MTENGSVADVENGGEPATLSAYDTMSNREDARMEPMQATGAEATVDGALRHPRLPELPARHHPVLPARQPSHVPIQQARLIFTSIFDGQSSLAPLGCRHAPRVAGRSARVAR